MPFSFKTRSQPVALFSNSSWKRMSPGWAGGKVGMGAGEQAERKTLATHASAGGKDERRSREGFMRGFYQNKLALSGMRSVLGDECRRSACAKFIEVRLIYAPMISICSLHSLLNHWGAAQRECLRKILFQ